jgi:hypothetical protein
MKIFRKIFIAWMLAWLPISGAMASIMPLCGHDGVAQTAHDHEHLAGQGAAHHDHDSSLQDDTGAAHDAMHSLCDNCNLCHLAGSILPPGNSASFPAIEGSALNIPPSLAYSTFYPETPQHPPRSRRT